MTFTVFILVASYLLGSIPFGVLITKWGMGIDVRKVGSGNIGATNVLRSGGKKEAILTLLADMLKGFLPVFLVQIYLGDAKLAAMAGSAAVVGHIFPVFLKFKGGKGVATALGVMFTLMPKAALTAIILFAIVTYLTKHVSLGSITAAVAMPFLGWYFPYGPYPIYASSFIAALIVFRHQENIHRLLSGEEHRLGEKKDS